MTPMRYMNGEMRLVSLWATSTWSATRCSSQPEPMRRRRPDIYRHWEQSEEKLGRKHQDGYFCPYALIRDPQTTNGSLFRSLKT